MAERGTPFVGVLFCGLAVTSRGVRVIEFNARFGDPETQAVLARLRTPLGQLLLAASRGEIAEDTRLEWDPRTAVDVVMAAENYPGTPRKGDAIAGLESASAMPDVHVVHAGTAVEGEEIVTAGGRVLAVVALGDTLAQARDAAYEGVHAITWEGAQYRTDIALKAVQGRLPCPNSATNRYSLFPRAGRFGRTGRIFLPVRPKTTCSRCIPGGAPSNRT